MELEVDKSTVTRRAVEMALEALQPLVNRNIEPKTKKRELEEYVGRDVAGSEITEHFRAWRGAAHGQGNEVERNLGPSGDPSGKMTSATASSHMAAGS